MRLQKTGLLILNTTPLVVILLFTTAGSLDPWQSLVLVAIACARSHGLDRTPLQRNHDISQALDKGLSLGLLQRLLALQLINPDIQRMQSNTHGVLSQIALLVERELGQDAYNGLDVAILPFALPQETHVRGENATDEKKKLFKTEDVDAGPLKAKDGPEGAQPRDGTDGLQGEEEVGEIGCETLLGERTVGHPEGIEETFPELLGVDVGKG
ncbi:unnamed protein product [Fusarium graminearum]|nr:hypothetical protein HG531_000684 [Fusarium graminearum]CZS82251.1 unnamed protein product [Fusarium graminearum]